MTSVRVPSRVVSVWLVWGATEYLSNPDIRLDQILRKDPNAPKLQIITSGAVPPNPAELLLGERLDELAAKLAEQFDFVLFDNVPFGSVADAAIANRIADLTIFVLRAAVLTAVLCPSCSTSMMRTS